MKKSFIGFFIIIFFLSFARIITSIYSGSSGDALRRYFYKCRITEIDKIPENSHIIIGHAYGAPNNNNKFLSPNIIRFIQANKQNIKTLIFSGDVLAIPTSYKWDKLFKFVGENISIYIAPGNHDIGLESNSHLRKVFFESRLSNGIYPQKLTIGRNRIILEDSVTSNWLMSKDIIRISESLGLVSNNIIIRHNIPIRELLIYANSGAGLTNDLPSFNNLSKQFKEETIVISGDTGAFKSLPRIGCWKYNNLKVIINGIGEIDGDSILLIHNENLFKYTLI